VAKLEHTIQANTTLNEIIHRDGRRKYDRHVEEIERLNQPFRLPTRPNASFGLAFGGQKPGSTGVRFARVEQSDSSLGETSDWIVDPALKPLRDGLVDEIIVQKSSKQLKFLSPSIPARPHASSHQQKNLSLPLQSLSLHHTSLADIDKLVAGFKVLNSEYSFKRLNEKADMIAESIKRNLDLMQMVEVVSSDPGREVLAAQKKLPARHLQVRRSVERAAQVQSRVRAAHPRAGRQAPDSQEALRRCRGEGGFRRETADAGLRKAEPMPASDETPQKVRQQDPHESAVFAGAGSAVRQVRSRQRTA